MIPAEFIYHGEIFEYREEGKQTRWFLIEPMKLWVKDHAEKCNLTIEPGFVEWAKKQGGVEMDRVEKMCAPYLHERVIAITEESGANLLVDGHHRMVRLFMDGVFEAKAYCIPFGQWEQFLLLGLPEDVTIMDPENV